MFKNKAGFDTLRSVVYSSITSSYAAVGPVLPSPVTVIAFTNNTDAVIYISTDGINDMIAIPGSTGKVFDIRTNAPNVTDYLFPQGTSFLVKYSGGAPTSGSFYIEAVITKK